MYPPSVGLENLVRKVPSRLKGNTVLIVGMKFQNVVSPLLNSPNLFTTDYLKKSLT